MLTINDIKFDEQGYGNITDYSSECPEGCLRFFAWVDFIDNRNVLCDHIFTATRGEALTTALWIFRGCRNLIKGIRIYQDEA